MKRLWDREETDVWPAFTDLFTGVLGIFILVAFASLLAKEELKEEVVQVQAQRDSLLALRLQGKVNDGSITITDGRIDIQEMILFAKGSAGLTDSGVALLQEMTPALEAYMEGAGDLLMVSGFTDDLQISNAFYASNWELSAMRATRVVKALVEGGFPRELIFAAGFGEYHPRVPNSNESGRKLNRRVEIVRVPAIERGKS